VPIPAELLDGLEQGIGEPAAPTEAVAPTGPSGRVGADVRESESMNGGQRGTK